MNDDVANGLQAYGSRLRSVGAHEVQTLQYDALAVAMYTTPAYEVSLPPLGVARLAINLSQVRLTGGLGGEPSNEFLARRHSLFLLPAGAGAAWRRTSSGRHINIYFHPRAFDHPEDAAWGPLLGAGVPMLNVGLVGGGAWFEMLAAEIVEAGPFSTEAIDSLARLILVRLARRQARGATRANPLTPLLQARLTDYVTARLDQRLLVSDLAAVTGLSPNRFAQCLASATGQSPHRYVLQLRLERAVQLLQHSTHSLADIAAACGFASQQHMTEVMHRRLGTTPARQRARPADPGEERAAA